MKPSALKIAWEDGSGRVETNTTRTKFPGKYKLSTRAQITSFGRKTKAV